MEVGFEGCLDMLMLCACCLLLCTLKHTHTHTYIYIYIYIYIERERERESANLLKYADAFKIEKAKTNKKARDKTPY